MKRLAKALSVAVYRNGKIEDVHAGECEGEDYFRGIPDSCMKAINIDVCNKIYTMLKLLLSTDEDDFKIANAVLRFSEMCASDWNEPELDDSIYNKELLEFVVIEFFRKEDQTYEIINAHQRQRRTALALSRHDRWTV